VATERVHVNLTGAPQTTLATLYAKALDADFEAPILGDRYAKDLVERIDYDWRKTAVTARNSPSVTSRSARFDSWVRQFLAVTPQAVVLDLGCGLDSRFFRVQPGPGVDWYDVDYPEIAELRKQLLPTGDHYHVVAASVSDPTWLRDIPADRPALMVAEGLTMYLTEQDGIALLRRVVDRFPSGELQFDAFNRLGIKWQWMNTPVRRSGSRLSWGIDGPEEILRAVPGIRLLAWVRWFEPDASSHLPRRYQALGRFMSPVPAMANMSQYHRYAFGPA
jgi:O-methyltransferase involved in polyketide biosynthesis